jgi:hypothetical protein
MMSKTEQRRLIIFQPQPLQISRIEDYEPKALGVRNARPDSLTADRLSNLFLFS